MGVGVLGGQRCWILWDLEVLIAVNPPVCGLGTELGLPGRDGLALITELSLQSC